MKKQDIFHIFTLLFSLTSIVNSAYAGIFRYGELYFESEEGEKICIVVPSLEETGYSGEITIPEKVSDEFGNSYIVVGIGQNAFRESGVKSVSCDGKIQSLGDYAFFSCPELIRVLIPSGIETLGDRSLAYCPKLKEVVLDGEYELLPDQIFYGDDSLENVILGNGYKVIGEGSFYGCRSLTSFVLPSSLEIIGRSGFEGCSGLKSLRIEGDGVEIKNYAFKSCSSLKEIFGWERIGIIGELSFGWCTSLESVKLGDKLSSIGESSFIGCSSLNRIEIGLGIKEIPKLAFSNCEGLQTVTIPGSIEDIGEMAFKNCGSLTQIELLSGIKRVGGECFHNCPKLRSIYVNTTIPPFAPRVAFERAAYREATVYVPLGQKLLFGQSPGWEHFLNIIETDDFPTQSGITEPGPGYEFKIHRNYLSFERDKEKVLVVTMDGRTLYCGRVMKGQEICVAGEKIVLVDGRKIVTGG